MREPIAERPDMAEYGVPASADGLLSWCWALERLHSAHNYWLATTRADGRPHLMAVWALWDGERDGSRDDGSGYEALYVSTAARSVKARNLMRFPNCSVSTERGDEAVIVEGVAELVQDPARLAELRIDYRAKYGVGLPDDSPVFRIRPLLAFGFIEHGDQFARTATRWRFIS